MVIFKNTWVILYITISAKSETPKQPKIKKKTEKWAQIPAGINKPLNRKAKTETTDAKSEPSATPHPPKAINTRAIKGPRAKIILSGASAKIETTALRVLLT